MAAISAFGVTQHSQICSLFFRNLIQCIALYQLHNSQALLNLRRGYFSTWCISIFIGQIKIMAINQLMERPGNSFLLSEWISNQSGQVSFSYHTQLSQPLWSLFTICVNRKFNSRATSFKLNWSKFWNKLNNCR